MDNLDKLASLLPEVAIAVIFAYVVIKLNQTNMDNHKEKTVAFLNEQQRKDQIIQDMSNRVMDVIQKNVLSHERLNAAIEINTKVTLETKDAMKEMVKAVLDNN